MMTRQIPLPGRAAPQEWVAPTLRVDSVSDLDELARHADAWDKLALAAPQRLPMLSHAWVASYLEHRLGQRESWVCLLAYEGDRLVGVLPAIITPHRLLGRWRPRLRAPGDPHTRSGDVLIAPGAEANALPSLWSALDRAVPGNLGVEFRGVREGSPLLAVGPAGSDRVVIRAFESFGSYQLLGADEKAFRARLGSKMRSNLKRGRERLAKRARVETRFLTGLEATEAMLPDFMALEASGWKGRRGTALAQSDSLRNFYASLARRLAARTWLEWHLLEADGHLVAAHLAVRFGQSIAIPKIAYDEAFADCSPGSILIDRLIERSFGEGSVDDINYASDMPWQRHWHMDRSCYYNIWVYPRRLPALICGALPRQINLLARHHLRPLGIQLRARLRPWIGRRQTAAK